VDGKRLDIPISPWTPLSFFSAEICLGPGWIHKKLVVRSIVWDRLVFGVGSQDAAIREPDFSHSTGSFCNSVVKNVPRVRIEFLGTIALCTGEH
jgi:hypothetical protein